jgi:hypothetical protein
MSNLEHLMGRIDELAVPPYEQADMDAVMALMEESVVQAGGLEALVKRYAGRPEPLLLRPLTFFAAQTVSRQGRAAVSAAVLRLLDQLRCDDESARTNLASALHLLAMYRALPEQAPPRLAPFLEEALRNGDMLRSAAVPATAAILAAGVRFTDSERVQLRTALKPLQEQDPELVDGALEALN